VSRRFEHSPRRTAARGWGIPRRRCRAHETAVAARRSAVLCYVAGQAGGRDGSATRRQTRLSPWTGMPAEDKVAWSGARGRRAVSVRWHPTMGDWRGTRCGSWPVATCQFQTRVGSAWYCSTGPGPKQISK
jgi:hypothetical protein